MKQRSYDILTLVLWCFLTLAKYYDLIFDKTMKPDWFDWFILIGGPIIIIVEIIRIRHGK